ncbi:NADP-dependent phosphogluconate dehydrogenase, partial [Bacillus subtilis subsp. spizizenii ATCC 6633 = JCM 2499]|nr:NADP-dependent phosphogluconate dehydrogenase [Bacillus spizizenii ATCC 6633 = JCM 2499]
PILTKIAAQVGDDTCCVYIGPKGAGHFTKMIQNGIVYADMQLISEAYTFPREPLRLPHDEIASMFETWNTGEQKSDVIESTAEILRKKDE